MISLSFSGPYAWLPGLSLQAISEVEVGRSQGIYLWTVPTANGELVYYVGDTARSYAERMEEHLAHQLSGMYRLYEPNMFMRGEKHLLWRGVYGPGSESTVAGFVTRLPELAPALVQFIHQMRFHVSQTSCEERLRKRIESALAMHLRNEGGLVGNFQEDDVRYTTLLQDENPVEVHFRWETRPIGVPEVLFA